MKKVRFGFKNAYYSKITETAQGEITYGTPVHLPGAVSMTLSPVGDDVEFYADDSLYYGESVNNGYDGSLELALIPDSFKKDILGETSDTNDVLTEDATKVSNPFALLCEFTTDDGATKFVFYRCMAKRPELSATTQSASKEVATETLDLTIRPRNDGLVKSATGDTTSTTVKNAWYTSVYEPNASI